MKKSQEEKRARLRAKAEKVIDEYLEWEAEHLRPDLRQIEEIALKLRKELGQEMAQMALEEQAEQRSVPGPRCTKCGQEMRYKGEKATQVESRIGSLKVERGHYYCPECQESIFPPGSAIEAERQALERMGSRKSDQIQRQTELRGSNGSLTGIGRS